MRRLLLAALLTASAFGAASPASACRDVPHCVSTTVAAVCSKVPCHICYYEPSGVQRCII